MRGNRRNHWRINLPLIHGVAAGGAVAVAAVTLLSVLAGIVVRRLSRVAQRERALQARLAGEKTRDTPLNPEQREAVQGVERSGNASLKVLNDALDYTKIEAGHMTVERIDVPLKEICEAVRSILLSAALERGISISVRYDVRLTERIKGDPARIRQVLLNLAGNAVKFTEHGSVTIAAERHDAAQLKISVTDTGIGIPADQMATLFKRYSEGDSSTARRPGGTGLGLAISKTLVELMGGQLGVLSHVGSGSTFWFVLPLEAAAASSAEAPGPAEATAETTARDAAAARQAARLIEPPRLPEPTRLLLVEDNFVNQRVALYMLAKLGFQVDVAQDGREALERLRHGRYRLILMDCQMPEMDGFEATQLIRDPNSGVLDHTVPIIAMTANTFPDDRARSIAVGMNDFLSKPVDQATLSAMIGKWLHPAAEAAVEETA